jgi:hypothetical protein
MKSSNKKHRRIALPSGCSISAPTIHPSNWNQTGASTSLDWYIHYRFFDPSIQGGSQYNKGKQCIVKGMNKFKNVADRREVTRQLLKNEMELSKYAPNLAKLISSPSIIDMMEDNAGLTLPAAMGWICEYSIIVPLMVN